MPGLPIPNPDLSILWAYPDDDRYFVVFSSRSLTPTVNFSAGHAFVTWGKWDSAASACTYESYGLYTTAGPVAAIGSVMFGPVPGEIQDETLNGFQSIGSTIDSVVVEVGPGYYGTSNYTMMQMRQDPQPYVLGSNDCVTFVQTIAKQVGLNPPGRDVLNTLPVEYIKALKQSAIATQTTTLSDGSTWSGPLVGKSDDFGGFPAGFGTFTCKDGSSWLGKQYGYQKVGPGVVTYPGQYTMHADFDIDGMVQGPFQVNFDNGGTLSGIMVDGYIEGIGTETNPNGWSYTGTFYANRASGSGCLTWKDGSKWVGPFNSGMANGKGWLYLPNGERWWATYNNGNPAGVQPIPGNVLGLVPVNPPATPIPQPMQPIAPGGGGPIFRMGPVEE